MNTARLGRKLTISEKKPIFDIALMNNAQEFRDYTLKNKSGFKGFVARTVYSEDNFKNCLGYRCRKISNIIENLQKNGIEVSGSYDAFYDDIIILGTQVLGGAIDDRFKEALHSIVNDAILLERRLSNTTIPRLVAETPQIQNTLYVISPVKNNNLEFQNIVNSFYHRCDNGDLTFTYESSGTQTALDIQRIMGSNATKHVKQNVHFKDSNSIGMAQNTRKRNGVEYDVSDKKALELILTDDIVIDELIKKCYAFDSIFFKKKKQIDLFYSIIEWVARERCTKFISNIERYYTAVNRKCTTKEECLNYFYSTKNNLEQIFVSESRMFEYENNNSNQPKNDYKIRLKTSEEFLRFCNDLFIENSANDVETIVNAICRECLNIINSNEATKSAACTYLELGKDFTQVELSKAGVFENAYGNQKDLTTTVDEKAVLNSTLIKNDEQFILTPRGIKKFRILMEALDAVNSLEQILTQYGYTICDLPLTYYMKCNSKNNISSLSGFLTTSYYKNSDFDRYLKTRYASTTTTITVDEDLIKNQYNIVTKPYDKYRINTSNIVTKRTQVFRSKVTYESENCFYKMSDILDIAILYVFELMFPDSFNYKENKLRIPTAYDFINSDFVKSEYASNVDVSTMRIIIGILIMIYRYLNVSLYSSVYSRCSSEHTIASWRSKYHSNLENSKRAWYTWTSKEIEEVLTEYNIDYSTIYLKEDYNFYFKYNGEEYSLTNFIIDRLEEKSICVRDIKYRNFVKTIRKLYDVNKPVNYEAKLSRYLNANMKLITVLYDNNKATQTFDTCVDAVFKYLNDNRMNTATYNDFKRDCLSPDYQSSKIEAIRYEESETEKARMSKSLEVILTDFFNMKGESPVEQLNNFLIYSIKTNAKETLDYAVMQGRKYLYSTAESIVCKLNYATKNAFKRIQPNYCNSSLGSVSLSELGFYKHMIFLCHDQFIDYDNHIKTIKSDMSNGDCLSQDNAEKLIEYYNAPARMAQFYDQNIDTFYEEKQQYDVEFDKISIQDLRGKTSDEIIKDYTKNFLYRKYKPQFASEKTIQFIRGLAPFNTMFVVEEVLKPYKDTGKTFDAVVNNTNNLLKNKGFFNLNYYIAYGIMPTITAESVYNLINSIASTITPCTDTKENLESFVYEVNSKRIKIGLLSTALEFSYNYELANSYQESENEDCESIADRRVCQLLLAEKLFSIDNFRNIQNVVYEILVGSKQLDVISIKVLRKLLADKHITTYFASSVKYVTDEKFINALQMQLYDTVASSKEIFNYLKVLEPYANRVKALSLKMLSLNIGLSGKTSYNIDIDDRIKKYYDKWKFVIREFLRKTSRRGTLFLADPFNNSFITKYSEDIAKYDVITETKVIYNKRTRSLVAYYEPYNKDNILNGGKVYFLQSTGYVLIIDTYEYKIPTIDGITLTSFEDIKEEIKIKLENR